MALEVIGGSPITLGRDVLPAVRICVFFPEHRALYTLPPFMHALQRDAFAEFVSARRVQRGEPALTEDEKAAIAASGVDLVADVECLYIRPNPEEMPRAFAADEQLQKLTGSKRKVKFLHVANQQVRDAIKRRGESWRLSAIPMAPEARRAMILGSRVGIEGLPIYYHNRLTGTRYLTYAEFAALGRLDEAVLERHLREIAAYASVPNRIGRPEIDFFAADPRLFGAANFAAFRGAGASAADVRARFAELEAAFRNAVEAPCRTDGAPNPTWTGKMLAALFLEGNEAASDEILSGLSSEFRLQIEWLPGGRFEDGELMFDPIFEEAAAHPGDKELRQLCDLHVKEFIFSFVREYGDLEYVVVGRVPEPIAGRRQQGRRGVYIAEFKPKSEPDPIKRIIRLKKWDVWEHLDDNADLLTAICLSDEYTDYWLDRQLACRQLRMNLPSHVTMRRFEETYTGRTARHYGTPIRSTYFERPYIQGIATDKIPHHKYQNPEYSRRIAVLLGRAGASSIIVGRSFEHEFDPVFDDGNEVVREDSTGFPIEIVHSDHSGAFGWYHCKLAIFAEYYAHPVNDREALVPDARDFAERYLDAFRAQFERIRNDYLRRRGAFDQLFSHRRFDPQGSFAYRWSIVLKRLLDTDLDALVAAIRSHIACTARNPGARPSCPR